MRLSSVIVGLSVCVTLLGCGSGSNPSELTFNKNPYPSTYRPLPQETFLIQNATVLTGTGERLETSDVLVVDGKISKVGKNLSADNAETIDGTGKWLTPGIIDVHSHLGAYPAPSVESHQDGNEITNPNTAEVWVEHSVWPQDPGFHTARAGGITTLQILPGSANLFGGRGVVLKNVPTTTVQAMKFPGAPYTLKMACGENPKRVYGNRNQTPGSRMGNMAGFRAAWARAVEYRANWEDFESGKISERPQRDLELETLRGVLDGEIMIHNHCYKAEEMAMMIDLGKEFGYHAGTFHHAVEAYKVADLLAENGNCAAMWPDWWGFKMEAYDMVLENIAIVDKPENSCSIVHSDSEDTIQRLNQEAAKVMFRANDNGFALKEEDVIQWITSNAAKSLGIDDKTGSIQTGKNADLVLWNQNPFSVYALADQVFIDGALVFDRFDRRYQPTSDFTLGQPGH
ncbi:amidohydrolase [Sessilibacter corallicola]|uniref:amidohydrolase n=1 Tax=Sessilibacter corallicola TaxID=2904075 RepID=UPI001E54DD31|nr:amidohydrolase [Sessilibacter corallicola]MCE2028316.1 amidohydrolase [Sessilibacter corallicola]